MLSNYETFYVRPNFTQTNYEKFFCERNGILVILQTSSLPCVGDKSTEKEKCPREILPLSDSHLSSIKLQHF